MQYYRAAKGEIRALEQKQQKAEHSRQRFEMRQERLRRAEEQKEADRKARAERAARAKEAQTQTASQDDPVARVQAQKAGLSEEQKKLKIEASMAQVALKKAEKQLATHASPELEAQVAELRIAASAAQQALDAANAAAPAVEAASAPSNDDALKKAKIEAAMLRAQLRKLEKREAPDDEQQAELTRLQAQLAQAEQTLADAQQNAPAAPKKAAGDDALKKAKIELAMKRAELKKAEKAGAEEAELGMLRDALSNAEKALHAAEELSAKPAPELVRTDKRPIDEQTRALKTDVAFARADLRKLERDDADSAAIETARQRLHEAERTLQEHTDSQGAAPMPPLPGNAH